MGTLAAHLGSLKLALVCISLQPIVFDSRVELSLLILYIEQDAFTLNECFIDRSLGLSIIKERNTDTDSTTQAEVGFYLAAPTVFVHGCGAGRSSCICADGWQLSCLCNLDVQIVLVELVLIAQKLRAILKRSCIDTVHSWDRGQSHLVSCAWNSDVESFFTGNLQDFLQLSFIVFNITFSLHDVKFILCSLCCKLC